MPVIVAREDYAAWLDPRNQDAAKLKGFIRPYPAERMATYPVSKAVSNARNEGAELIRPL
jgi:putative SOS response-associated peptidase YedK